MLTIFKHLFFITDIIADVLEKKK